MSRGSWQGRDSLPAGSPQGAGRVRRGLRQQISPAQLELLLQFPEETPGAERSETDCPQGEQSESKEPASPGSAAGADTWEAPPVIAPLPPSLQDAGLAAPGLLAAIITAKYCDHLPLSRQEYIYMTRHGIALSRQPRPLGGAETDCL